jgi:glycosyltransferase involved in cell wall biosynthesis
MVPGRTGLLLDDASPRGIASALQLLIDDAELRQRLGASAAEHARARFDPRTNARAVEAVYDQLLGIAPPAERGAVRELVHA